MDKESRGRMGRRRKQATGKVVSVSGTEGARRASVVADTPAAEVGGPLGPGAALERAAQAGRGAAVAARGVAGDPSPRVSSGWRSTGLSNGVSGH